jgi:hypothetical protein
MQVMQAGGGLAVQHCCWGDCAAASYPGATECCFAVWGDSMAGWLVACHWMQRAAGAVRLIGRGVAKLGTQQTSRVTS